MYQFFFVAVFCLFEHTSAYCCFRDPWTLPPACGYTDFVAPCGVISCPYSYGTCGSPPNSNTASCYTPFSVQYPESSFCNCGLPACSCYRDTSNVCFVNDIPSPVCSCLNSLNDDCGCDAKRSFIYFPEVEYPVVALDMKPFYYSGCFTF